MKLKKTIAYIGSHEDERQLFEKALVTVGKNYNFLPLDRDDCTLSLLKRSQPFWFASIFVDVSDFSSQQIQYLKEIKEIPQLHHVPVIVNATTYHLQHVNIAKNLGVANYIVKPLQTYTLRWILNALQREEVIPFTEHYPLHEWIAQAEIPCRNPRL